MQAKLAGFNRYLPKNMKQSKWINIGYFFKKKWLDKNREKWIKMDRNVSKVLFVQNQFLI